MANVIIVSKHLFYNDNGVDVSMGMTASDIMAFSNMQKAEEFVEEQISMYGANDDTLKFDKYAYEMEDCICQGAKAMISYSQMGYDKNGVRRAFRIVKRVIE
jgi:hypothetical protein